MGTFRIQLLYKLVGLQVFLILVSLGFCSPASAQTQSYPNTIYYSSFSPYYYGEYRDALKSFQAAGKGSVRIGSQSWIDSICYHTMKGECYYRVGNLSSALDEYNAALLIYVNYTGWLDRLEFKTGVLPNTSAVQQARINWGTTTRTTVIGKIPTRVQIAFGNSDQQNFNALNKGGVIRKAEYRLVNVAEIMRCTALAISRRTEILGPITQHDALTKQVSASASKLPASRNAMAIAWSQLVNGCALASMNEYEKAAPLLQSSIQIGRQYDHPLTPLAMIELAKVYYKSGKYKEAGTLALEATYTGAIFGEQDVIREGFELGTTIYHIQGNKGVYPPLANAGDWARTKGSKQLQASLNLLAAQSFVESGAPNQATAMLAQAKKIMGRNDLGVSDIGVRAFYRAAHASFQKGDFNTGNRDLATAGKLLNNHSKWLFRIRVADRLYTSGRITPRVASRLYEELLREPTPRDWIEHPIETLAYVTTRQDLEREHWFEVAQDRKEHDKAMEIADSIRRHRFFGQLPVGGRLHAFRWMLEAPTDILDPSSIKLRQGFLAKFPAYQGLSKRSSEIQEKLRTLPFVPEEKSDEEKQKKQLLEELTKVSVAQETLLSDIALRREPSSFAFPPEMKFEKVKQSTPAKQVTLSFISTRKGVYSFLLTNENYAFQELANFRKVRGELQKLLRKLGQFNKNTQLDADQLADETWKTHAQELMKILLPKAKPDFWDAYDELVIVPDGILWYLPFEILQVGEEGGKTENLIDKVRIRYAPTMSTSIPDMRPIRQKGNNVFVTGKLYPRDDKLVSRAALETLQSDLPESLGTPARSSIPTSILSSICDQLTVWHDIDETTRTSGFDWFPLQIDKGKPGGTLGEWMALPWHGPEVFIMPGYHTAAEAALGSRANGEEVFQSICGMMSMGARTMLISRWRVGGQSAYDLSSDFTKNLVEAPASVAWKASLKSHMGKEIDIEKEPRLKKSRGDLKPDPKHPFFWAGYMLIDNGSTRPKKD